MKKSDSIKSKLQSTDDETLKRMIESLAAATGTSEDRKRAMISDLPKIRRLLTESGDEQLSALISSLGIGNLGDALKKLNGEKK